MRVISFGVLGKSQTERNLSISEDPKSASHHLPFGAIGKSNSNVDLPMRNFKIYIRVVSPSLTFGNPYGAYNYVGYR